MLLLKEFPRDPRGDNEEVWLGICVGTATRGSRPNEAYEIFTVKRDPESFEFLAINRRRYPLPSEHIISPEILYRNLKRNMETDFKILPSLIISWTA